MIDAVVFRCDYENADGTMCEVRGWFPIAEAQSAPRSVVDQMRDDFDVMVGKTIAERKRLYGCRIYDREAAVVAVERSPTPRELNSAYYHFAEDGFWLDNAVTEQLNVLRGVD